MDYVICPYCGEGFAIETCEIRDGDQFIEECPHCKKEMEIYAEVVLELSTDEVRYFTCDICGKKEYEIDSQKLPYEKESGKWEYKKLCGGCYWKELMKRREG